MVQVGLATAQLDGRAWYHLHDAGFACMQSVRVVELRRCHQDFKGRVGQPFIAPQKVGHEAVRVKPKVRQRPQKLGEAKTVEHLLRKATESPWKSSRDTKWTAARNSVPLRLPKHFGTLNTPQLV